MLVVAVGGEGDLRQSEVVLRAGQCGVQHQQVALQRKENTDFRGTACTSSETHKSVNFKETYSARIT